MDKKNILTFVIGACIGSLFTFLYMSEKHKRFLEEEADWCENLANEIKTRETDEERSNRIEEELNNEFEQEKKVLIMNKDRYKKIATNYSNSPEIPEPKIKQVRILPYVISFEEFCEGEDNHDKITITYYAGDGILVDEEEEIIEDVERLVGEDNLINKFGEGSDDPDVLYVRNERMGIDYEIVRQHTCYSEVVSGECKET